MTATVLDRPGRALGWPDAAVTAGVLVTAAAAALSDPSSAAIGLGALGVALAAWFAFGRRTEGGAPGWLPFVILLVGVSAVGALASPAFATFQVVALPLAWMLTPGLRSALAANAAVALAIGIGYAAAAGPLAAIAVEGVSFGFSMAMGAWITRIERRSAERQALIERLTAAQEQVAALNREAGAVAERERLARELHDTLTQSVTGVVMLAERARSRDPSDGSLKVLEDAARQALAEARGLVAAGASVPMEGGLAAALDVLAARFRRETGLAVDVVVEAEVPRGLEVVLLRCAQEGFANVRKHAGGAAVAVRVGVEGDEAVLVVQDDGRGPGGGSGFGVEGMRDRLALVAGSLDISPGPGAGTVLTVRVPLPAAAAS